MSTTVQTRPIFTRKGIILTGKTISAANTAKDGTGTTVTIYDPAVTISSLTSSSTTATASFTNITHGFLHGEEVLITGATPVGYNGVKTISLTGAGEFTYTVAAGLTTPATGTIIAYPINGIKIEKVIFQPTAANSATTAARIFVNNGQSAATAANNIYVKDATLPINTLSEVATMAQTEITLNMVLPPFYKLNITLGSSTGIGGFAVYVIGGAY
jgi:hypothetical protein